MIGNLACVGLAKLLINMSELFSVDKRAKVGDIIPLWDPEEKNKLFNPACDASAVDIYEGNATGGASRQTGVQIEACNPDETLTYQKVMQRIIQRYIFDIQREAEVTEDDFEEIKQDISSFRYEMLSQWRTRESLLTEISANMISMGKQLEALKRYPSPQKNKKI